MTSIIFTSLLMVLINSNGSKNSFEFHPSYPKFLIHWHWKRYKGAGYIIIVTGKTQPIAHFVWMPFVDPMDILYFHFRMYGSSLNKEAAFTIWK